MSSPPYLTNNLAFHVGDQRDRVLKNRSLLAVNFGPTIYMNQIHGDTVVVVDGSSDHEPSADGLVTQQSGIALAVLVADCIPLLLWDEEHRTISAVHVGRRGLVSGIAAKAIGIMRALGADQIHALLGPSICGRCYEVGPDVYREVTEAVAHAESLTRTGSFALDLSRALQMQLQGMGVIVTPSTVCTVENPDFYSYRRDGVTGRQAGVIRL